MSIICSSDAGSMPQSPGDNFSDDPLMGDLDVDQIESNVTRPIDDKHQRLYCAIAFLAVGLIAALIVGVTITYDSESDNNRGELYFLHSSDLHLDPYYDSTKTCKSLCRSVNTSWDGSMCSSEIIIESAEYEAPLGRPGCNIPPSLLDSTLDAMRRTYRDPQFVLLSGDLSAHGVNDVAGVSDAEAEAAILSTVENVLSSFREKYPDTVLLPAIGNNDVPTDYTFPANSDYVLKLSEIYYPYISCGDCGAKATAPLAVHFESFLAGGYYSVELRDYYVVVLNTLPFSFAGDDAVLAASQLAWLASELETAEETNKNVLIMGHIPPLVQPINGYEEWNSDYIASYNAVTLPKAGIIAAQLFGHFHFDDFRVMLTESDSPWTSILLTPALTPFFTNNPSWRAYLYYRSDTWLKTFRQHYLDLYRATFVSDDSWTFDYDFAEAYGVDDLSPKSLHEAAIRLINDGSWSGDGSSARALSSCEIPDAQRTQHYMGGRRARWVDPHDRVRFVRCPQFAGAQSGQVFRDCVDNAPEF
eukprot:Rmarinus@m.3052